MGVEFCIRAFAGVQGNLRFHTLPAFKNDGFAKGSRKFVIQSVLQVHSKSANAFSNTAGFEVWKLMETTTFKEHQQLSLAKRPFPYLNTNIKFKTF